MFLMETKNQDDVITNTFNDLEYAHMFTVPPQGLSGGLALFWQDNVEVEILASAPNYIDTKIKHKKEESFVTFVYGAPQTENRSHYWDTISRLGAHRNSSWMLTGDFNDILDNSEKVGGPLRWEGSFLAFRSFVSQNGLWDIKHSRNSLSWRGVRYQHAIKSRLDRSLVNYSWSERFPTGRCQYLRFEGSDHRPLITYFGKAPRRKKGTFRFDRRLRGREEVRLLVKETWELAAQDSVLFKISSCRQSIIQWTKEQNENSAHQIKKASFSAAFYHAYWDIIGQDVYRDIRKFFETSHLSPRQNETHVCLIPKVSGPRKVADYRPIALCNVHYKIIAKILTRRLQPWLSQIVSKYQSGFVPGRAIADNVLVTHEILHFLRISGAKKYCSMAIKTDMSKAYDRIEWDFLQAVLQRLGFHDKWISWIMECVKTVSYSFLINGSPQGKVQPGRGLRQGDPLSPYLFILCTEVLSGLCKQAQEKGTLKGIRVARGSLLVNHLLFADDTMFFCKTNPTCCATLKNILERYEKASGQCINLQKSAITFSSKTPQEIKRRVSLTLQIDKEGGIGKYLGLPEHFGRKKRDIFSSIVDRIRQR